jgi:hypothetical protein
LIVRFAYLDAEKEPLLIYELVRAWLTADGSDGTFSKTTSLRAYKGVFEEYPSDPSVLANPSAALLFVVEAEADSEIYRATLGVDFR